MKNEGLRHRLSAVISKGILPLLCTAALAGCTQAAETQINETTTVTAATTATTTVTTTVTATEAVTTTTTAATTTTTTTTAPRIPAEKLTPEDSGLDITYKNGWVYVCIPADYTDENIGIYFNTLDDNIIFEPEKDGIFCVSDGALYSKDMTKLYSVPYQCEDEHNMLVPIVGLEKSFTVPEGVTWISPNAFYKERFGEILDTIYVYEGISDENIAELNLSEFTTVKRTKKEEKTPEISESRKRIREQADFFNNNEDEMALLIANITEKAGDNYTFSSVSGEGAEAHIYMYQNGEPVMLAVIYNYGDELNIFYESADKSLVYQLYITPIPEKSDNFYINEAHEMNPHNN